ncbi:MAG: PAC2 family protein [Candidatus Diapherotrites archaeon]
MPKRMDLEFVETEDWNLKGYTLIEGFPGMGLVGTISAKYLVEKMNFKQIGFVDSDNFMPIIRIHDGMPVHPSRIYASAQYKLVVLISEQIISQQHTQHVANSVVDWIRKKGISRVISLAGINSPSAGEGVQIFGIAANESGKKFLQAHNIELIKEGVTTGVTALILLQLKDLEDVEAISILGSVKIGADYKASAELLKKLDEILGLDINVAPLLKEAKEMEKALMSQLQKMKESQENVAQMEDHTPMYT